MLPLTRPFLFHGPQSGRAGLQSLPCPSKQLHIHSRDTPTGLARFTDPPNRGLGDGTVVSLPRMLRPAQGLSDCTLAVRDSQSHLLARLRDVRALVLGPAVEPSSLGRTLAGVSIAAASWPSLRLARRR